MTPRQRTPVDVDPQGWASLREVMAIGELLTWTGQALRRHHLDYAPLQAVAAAAAERFLKLGYALGYHERYNGMWPTLKGYGHDIQRLDGDARKLIRETHDLPPIVDAALGSLDADPWIDRWLEILTAYAAQGRYEHMNQLVGQATGPSPHALSDELDSDLGQSYDFAAHATFTNADHQALDHHVRNALADSWDAWHSLYSAAWAHGVFGPQARQMSSEILPGR